MGSSGVQEVVLVSSTHSSTDTLVSQAQLVGDLGFRRISMGESNGRNIVPLLTLIADHTETLGLSNDVFSPFSRSPALIAQTAAVLDEISGGRVRLGIGTSSPALTQNWHGRTYDRPLLHVRETVEIIREVLNGDPLDYSGELYDLSALRLRAPLPENPVPIDIASLGPKSVEQTGEIADGWVPQMFTPDGLRERLEDLHRGLRNAGRDPDDVRVTISIRCCVLEDREGARDLARKHIVFLVGAYGPYYYENLRRQGHEDVADEIRQAWSNGERKRAAAAIPDELLDDLVASGHPEDAHAVLEKFAAVEGVDVIRMSFPVHASLEVQNQTMRALAP